MSWKMFGEVTKEERLLRERVIWRRFRPYLRKEGRENRRSQKSMEKEKEISDDSVGRKEGEWSEKEKRLNQTLLKQE